MSKGKSEKHLLRKWWGLGYRGVKRARTFGRKRKSLTAGDTPSCRGNQRILIDPYQLVSTIIQTLVESNEGYGRISWFIEEEDVGRVIPCLNSECPMAATLFYQNNKRKIVKTIRRQHQAPKCELSALKNSGLNATWKGEDQILGKKVT